MRRAAGNGRRAFQSIASRMRRRGRTDLNSGHGTFSAVAHETFSTVANSAFCTVTAIAAEWVVRNAARSGAVVGHNWDKAVSGGLSLVRKMFSA